MDRFKRYILPFFFVSCAIFSGKSQTPISGIINTYTKVTSIDAIDKVTVSSAAGFFDGDTVLIIQMRGARFDVGVQALEAMNGTGRYEFIAINKILGNQIEFRSELINYLDYRPVGSIQMVRVPSYDKAKVVASLTCQPWDGSKGGIIALIVNDTLTLNDSIYANAKGFRGGAFTINAGNCPSSAGGLYYLGSDVEIAGLKGEGVVPDTFIYTRGRGYLVNAGGGGYGRFSGGGGGGNYGAGGRGGKMKEFNPACPDPNAEGSGGKSSKILPYYFGNSGGEYRDRIFMGGGGGAGTGTELGNNGGNGGGLIFIIARNLRTNGKYISANGGDVVGNSPLNSGAGGGGAGGSILLSVDEISGPLNVSVKGGKGGNGNADVNECWGQGGGGGAGIVWFSADQLTFNSLLKNGGPAGGPSGSCGNMAFFGEPGDTINKFNAILNGFLFNLISKSQSICYGTVPQLLKGSYPRGGDRDYKYQWQKRPRLSSIWQNIVGANSKDYQPPKLYDTTYFRRVVKVFQPQWDDTVVDTSKYIIINVVPEIKFNEIFSDTAICYGLPQVLLRGKTPTGGKGGFSYLWEISDGTSAWTGAPGTNNQLNYGNTSNTQTLYYRRKVFSTFCMTVSDVDTIIVYPKITNNVLSSSQTICYNYYPEQLTGQIPSHGDGSYIYKWERSENDSSSWIDIGVSTQDYAPPKLVNKTYYHRIVFSGLNNTCKDTSNWVRMSITPSILNNTIQSAQTICEGSTPALFNGSLPAGGNNNYLYQWEISIDKIFWDSLSSDPSLKDYQHSSLFDTVYFRRIVRSGIMDCCKDTSLDIKITVQPKIQNNIISADREICKGQTPVLLEQLSGLVSGGDKVNYVYSWEQKTDGTWSNISGANLSKFQPPPLVTTTYYHRKVVSGECVSYSDSLKMNVLELIAGNVLSGNNEVCRGLVPARITGGVLEGGTPGIYRYQWEDSTAVSWNIITDADSSDFTPYVLSEKTYFRRVVKSGLNDCCISRSPALEIRINELPVGNLASMDTAVCNGEDIDLKVSIDGNAPFSLQFTDQSVNYPVENLVSGDNKVMITPQNSGLVSLYSIADAKGCLASSMLGEAKVRLVPVPKAAPGSDAEVCALSYNLKAMPSVGIGKWQLTMTDATFTPSGNDPKALITMSTYGSYELYWKETNEFCSDSAKITLTFYKQPQKPTLSRDTTLNYKFLYSLSASEPEVGSGTWSTLSPDVFIKSPGSPNTIAEQLSFGEHQFIWQVTNGNCIPMSDTIKVKVDDILRYTGFSPNGDGINEEFFIEGLENAKTKKLLIMNRWGGVVYSDDDYKNDWKGTNNDGQMLTNDTYFYVLTVDGSRIYKGFVVLKR